MGKSAKIIGREEFGLNAREMNNLLKEHGYLDGQPGAYGLTDKGRQFGHEREEGNGVPGLTYGTQWTERTWDPGLASALRADLETANLTPRVAYTDRSAPQAVDEGEHSGSDAAGRHSSTSMESPDGAVLLGAVVIVGMLAVRFGPKAWERGVKPAAKWVQSKWRKDNLD